MTIDYSHITMSQDEYIEEHRELRIDEELLREDNADIRACWIRWRMERNERELRG